MTMAENQKVSEKKEKPHIQAINELLDGKTEYEYKK